MIQSKNLVKGAIHYQISFPNANLHYATVQITAETKGAEHVDFSMPVWTPGSYMVREFSQHVDSFFVKEDELETTRLNKNTWRVNANGKDLVSIEYEVYSFTVSVRHSYVDEQYAFIHGVSTFMCINGREDEKIVLSFDPLRHWKNIEVALPKNPDRENSFLCENFDLLADSPVALGNFEVLTYESGNLPHRVIMMGNGHYDPVKIVEDFKKIGDVEVEIFKEHPSSPHFIHFVQNVESGGGGLEHLNCQTSQVVRTAYKDEEKYVKFLGLIAHEQFHLWNVKRIRPIELGPFNYNEENYSKQLWVAEGITSYYDDLVLLRSAIHTEDSYFKEIASNINRLQNTPGRKFMSLEESSLTAWIKFYRSNENSGNTAISYYNKGMLVTMALDLEILQRTNGEKSMDDVLRALYAFYKKEDRGFTIEEFWGIVENTVGSAFGDFYRKYVVSTDEIDYNLYLNYVGIQLEDENSDKPIPWLGIATKEEKGRCMITSVTAESSGLKAGLSVNDELIALNNFRVSGDGKDDIKILTIGAEVAVTIARNGEISTVKVMVQQDPEVKFKLVSVDSPTEEQAKLKAVWLSNRP